VIISFDNNDKRSPQWIVNTDAEPSICPERERLAAEVIAVMGELIDILLQQRRALRASGNVASLLDADFGKAVGAKERAIGALCEHEKEHGCR